MKQSIFLLGIALVLATWSPTAQAADHSLAEFPRLSGETDDAPRIQRAVDATPSGVLDIGPGLYKIARTVSVTNLCSLRMERAAYLVAVAQMDFVLRVNNAPLYESLDWYSARRNDYGMFVCGGMIDGNGLASCMMLDGFHHYTLRDTTFLNGKRYGLAVDAEDGTGYELVAKNLYFKCVMPGLAGNTAFFLNGGDCHVTDCFATDYTVGFHLSAKGSNRLTRCHVRGGDIPPAAAGEPPEMLKNSVCFKLGSHSAILRDCHADIGATGYEIDTKDTRFIGCSAGGGEAAGLDNTTLIRHVSGRLLATDCAFTKNAANCQVYDGCGRVQWRDAIYTGFGPGDSCPGAAVFGN
jgi:hypothetical protein